MDLATIPQTFAAGARPGELFISRTFAAPRELVFDVWTKPEHLVNWWGPRDYPAVSFESDARPGGRFSFLMVGPNGEQAPAAGTYEVVDRPERLVVRSQIEHEGRTIFEARVTVTLSDAGAYTRLTLQTEVLHDEDFPGTAGAIEGWSQQLDKLTEYLVSLR